MRNIPNIVKKELLQIFRNKQLLPLMTIIPIVQIIVLSLAASYDIYNLKIAVWDMDRSNFSHKLQQKYVGSGFFELKSVINSQKEADDLLMKNKVDLILVVPQSFEKDIIQKSKTDVQIQINAMNNVKAGITNNYAVGVVNDFARELKEELKLKPQILSESKINPVVNYWFNPTLNYKTIMVPGIIAEILSLIVMLLSALNIVREREIGTIEQLNVTPIKKHEFVLGKLIPFWIIGHFIFWIGILAGKIFYNIPIEGNLLLLELFVAVYLTVPLGFGLLISNLVDTQQQALFTCFFFIIIFILMCGLFTPLETMPKWAQWINVLNPIRYLVEVNRLILLKGSGINVIYPFVLAMLGYGIIINAVAIKTYKKTN